MAGSYVEFTVNVNEESGTDSSSSIKNKVRDNSDKSEETKKLEKQAKNNMSENNPGDDGSGDDKKSSKTLKGFIATSLLKETTSRAVSLAREVSYQEALYGGSTAEANAVSNTWTNISGVTSSISSVAGWTVAGATFGPYGAAAGAVIGLVVEAFDLITDYNKRSSEFEWKKQEDRLATQRNMQRIGRVTSSRGR